VAKTARDQLESQLGHTIITSENAKDFNLLEDMSETGMSEQAIP